jgi:DNA-binding CsgD family transcriptional regulator
MAEPLSRTEKILLQLLLIQTREETLAVKVARLNRVGLSNTEIADILDSTSATVAQSLYMARSKNRAKAVQPQLGHKGKRSVGPATRADSSV